MRSHDRWSLRALLIAVMVAAGGCGDASRAAAPPPPPIVKVEPVVERDVPISAEWVATLVGYINAASTAHSRSRIRRRFSDARDERPFDVGRPSGSLPT